jgi:hypothetical protein
MNKFELMKVFDCQKMPSEIRQVFFQIDFGVGNDSYVKFFVRQASENCVVSKWLVENGAVEEEDVIISCWW